jgi:hypothetical protein
MDRNDALWANVFLWAKHYAHRKPFNNHRRLRHFARGGQLRCLPPVAGGLAVVNSPERCSGSLGPRWRTLRDDGVQVRTNRSQFERPYGRSRHPYLR